MVMVYPADEKVTWEGEPLYWEGDLVVTEGDAIEHLSSEWEPENAAPAKCWGIWIWVKSIPRWIYVLVLFLAELLTCIYFLWWLWATFWKK
jgi:hypothetical protein